MLKDNEFEKSRRVLAAKHKSLVHEHDRRNKLQAAQAIDENEEDAFLRQENSATPLGCSRHQKHVTTETH